MNIEEVIDVMGNPICPGNFVIYSVQDRSELEMGVVQRITTGKTARIYIINRWAVSEYRLRPKSWLKNKKKKGFKPKCSSYFQHNRNRVVVIQNPLFGMDNDKIAEVIQYVDKAKDLDWLPSDYEFGKPFELGDEE